MLSLDSPRWAELKHAYGNAQDIPDLLRQLGEMPYSKGDEEPWFSLWSALAHQGDIYSATLAAVPHVVEALASSPGKADSGYFHFPAWVEICRVKNCVEIPEDLQLAYDKSLARLPHLVAAVSDHEWDADFLASVLAALAAAKGHPVTAEAILEFSSADVAEEFIEWFFNR